MGAQSEAQFQPVAASDQGGTLLVPGVVGKKIRVLALALVAGGTVTAALQSVEDGDEYGTALTGDLPMASGSQVSLGFNPLGWCETDLGEGLSLDLSAGVAVGGALVYTEVE